MVDRAFVFAGDSAFETHEVTRFCHRHRRRLTLVSQCHPDVNLFAPPPPYRGIGRPPGVWAEGGTRRVETVTGTGHRYKGGNGLVPIQWVFVTDATGTHRDEYLLTTDTTRTADAVVGTYCGR